ncbi:hypothetical protein NL108_010711 [Boleophthalmus pectinirostris]|nr:hypothetical protein NL108_010711 [Boleophthalmus pectinirostris]
MPSVCSVTGVALYMQVTHDLVRWSELRIDVLPYISNVKTMNDSYKRTILCYFMLFPHQKQNWSCVLLHSHKFNSQILHIKAEFFSQTEIQEVLQCVFKLHTPSLESFG